MIKTHFFGNDCIIDRALKNRDHLALNLKNQRFNFQNILTLSQVHGNNVVIIDDKNKIYGEQDLPKVDGIVTNLFEVVLIIVTADCSPILFFDEENKIIGACHAGWRGAKSGIIANTVEAMKTLGANNISAKIGPMIQQNSYEISQDFYDDFVKENPANAFLFKRGVSSEKFLFDLSQYVENKIKEQGIENVNNCRIDTYSQDNLYFSYRRASHQNIADCGRNVSAIVIN